MHSVHIFYVSYTKTFLDIKIKCVLPPNRYVSGKQTVIIALIFNMLNVLYRRLGDLFKINDGNSNVSPDNVSVVSMFTLSS